MEGFKRQAVLLTLLDAMKKNYSWCGETHLQKSAFFLEEGLGVPLDFDFVLYKYGPFSFQLREVLGEMRANLLIEVEPSPPYGPSLRVSESGQTLRERFPKTIGNHQRAIDFVAERLSAKPVAELERLGTALYVLKKCNEENAEDRVRRITELKPHILSDQAEEAHREVVELLAAGGRW
jgi:hypothetical protein